MTIDLSRGLENFSRVPSSEVLKRLSGLMTDFEHAEEQGLFVPLPKAEPELSADKSRVRAIRNRLANLGYLAEDSENPDLDEELREAIRSFQREAGLTVDGWVGSGETWPALQELVNFETDLNVSFWLEEGRPDAALRRAVALRLFVLGLSGRKTACSKEDFSEGLAQFESVWNVLDFEKSISPAGFNAEWIGRLFDQDGLVRRLAEVSQPVSSADLADVHGFVLNVAKIELWLAGYSVSPTGYDLEPSEPSSGEKDELSGFKAWMKSTTVVEFLRIKKELPFYSALMKFWQDQGADSQSIDSLCFDFLDTFPRFFQAIQSGLRTDEEMTDLERQELILLTLEKYPDQVVTVWSYVQALGNRIWDGLRRTWGWLKIRSERTDYKGLDIGRNLSRLIYRYTLGSYTVVLNLLQNLGRSITFLAKPYLEISDPKVGIISHARDFDFRFILNGSAGGGAINDLCENLRRETRLFLFTCRSISVFLSILATVTKTFGTGYVGLVIALVRFRRVWNQMESLSDEYRLLFETGE
jgi:hypothetical protein